MRDTLPVAVHWVRSSAEYRALCLEIYGAARAAVERRAAGRAPGTWAVALDADDTVLDNSGYEVEVWRRRAPYTEASWREWVERRSRGAVPGAAGFLRAVRALGGKIAIVTNTVQPLCAATEENFRALDLPYDVMLCRPEHDGERKETRWRQVTEGSARPGLPPLDILAWVGDNIQDFPDRSQALRQQPEAAYADFGERFFVIPNPVYGSWEANPPR